MRIILLCGGQGARLWPLSYPGRTKPFIPLFDGPDGKQSAIQRIWKQLERSGLSRFVRIVIGADQEQILLDQLGTAAHYVIEPEGRGTYPAVVYAAADLFDGDDADEVVISMPADLDVDDSFYEHVLALERQLIQSEAQLGLLGVKPTEVSSKYGYMVPQPKESRAALLRIDHFVEKPAMDEAMQLIAQGALWNCGVTAMRVSYLKAQLEQDGVVPGNEGIAACVGDLNGTSIDCKLLQHAVDIIALPYEGKWTDVGSWETLAQAWEASANQSGISGEYQNINVINDTELTVKVDGLSDLLVVVSAAGILIRKQSPSNFR
ncbi:sugar phosphate nucleotidyltransferase [Paenibacillus sp. R14(2021)]|uniref:sugar phosphate nucleotidyltransferase n=1 Tax=Paenibacillus sp. R14(2021) TaxID=2859228 RepID=UPI001C6142CE|nr:sugar phosphate nucleotidyltransferase [Paenibacillus sp. R14(2021)]